MVIRRQGVEKLGEHRLVVFDKLSFRAALLRATERIEHRPPQEFELRQYPEGRKEPRTEAHFARQSGLAVTSRQKRRRQVKLETQIVAVKGTGHLRQECAIGIKPRDFVFV